MARTSEGATLTQTQYRLQLAARAKLLLDMQKLWPLFDATDFSTFDTFSDLAAALVRAGYITSAGIASAYLSAFQIAEGIAKPEPAVLVPPPDEDYIKATIRASGLVAVRQSRIAGFALEAAKRAGFVAIAGAAGRLALSGGRGTIVGTTAKQGVSWARVTASKPCAFCSRLAARGAVYGAGADFDAHNHCSCTAEPSYSGSRLPASTQAVRERWNEVTDGLDSQDAVNAFRRALG